MSVVGNKQELSKNVVGNKQASSKSFIGIKAPSKNMMNGLSNPKGTNYNPEKGIINTFNNVDVVNTPITSKPPQMKTNKFTVEKQKKEIYKEPYV